MLGILALVLMVALPVTAVSAPTVSSQFVTAPIVEGALVCRIANEASGPRRVRVEALGPTGRPEVDSGAFRLQGGASYVTGGGVGARRCRFTVDDPSGLRAHGLVLSSDGSVESLPPSHTEASRRQDFISTRTSR